MSDDPGNSSDIDPSRDGDAARLPHDEGLRALYAQLPDIEPGAHLDEAILLVAGEASRGQAPSAATRAAANTKSQQPPRLHRPASGRAIRVLRWSLPVAAAAGVMFVVVRDRGIVLPMAEQTSATSSAEHGSAASPDALPSPKKNEARALRLERPERDRPAARDAMDRDARAAAALPPPGASAAPPSPPAPPPLASAAPPSPPAPPPAQAATPPVESALPSFPAAPAAKMAVPLGDFAATAPSDAGALAAMRTSPEIVLTRAHAPWPLGLEYGMPADAACTRLRPLLEEACTFRNGAAELDLKEPFTIKSGTYAGREIRRVRMLASENKLTTLILMERATGGE